MLIVPLSNLRFSASYPHTSYAGMLRDRFSFHPSTQKTRSRRVCDDLSGEGQPITYTACTPYQLELYNC